ncbi:L,D-transpeptidase [Patescibacteria group bacterium]|nr:L,D-transpeptidase [Patescibacteria group bacterium]MBU1613386.1 L,D-transpeptidase [Patescibacteria group bacterium]
MISFVVFFFSSNISFAATPLDSDSDGLDDALEQVLGTNPNNPDSDGDGHADAVEIKNGYNPLKGNNDRGIKRTVQVDLSAQMLRYYVNGIEVGAFPVSTGVLGMDTPKGEFAILRKLPLVNYRGWNYNYPNTKWNLEFKNHYYLHGAFWHNQFGIKPMSHGCVNIAYKNAEKLYKFLQVGDVLKVVGATPRKPLKQKVAKD